jgi:acetolactate decarboxylase
LRRKSTKNRFPFTASRNWKRAAIDIASRATSSTQFGWHFQHICTRAVNPPEPGTRLVDAARSQSEFHFDSIDGTLIGLWSPGFSSAFSVAGYHFHFLSRDRQHGGHLLDLCAGPLRLRVEALTSIHLVLPESEPFLKADLSRNTAKELAYAEQPIETLP